MTMSSTQRDSAVQTTELTLLIDGDRGDGHLHSGTNDFTLGGKVKHEPERGRTRQRGKPSAVRRHFAQYEHQQELNSEFELGWDCGICFETAEDPCVTRCGHLYCQSHLNQWLTSHPTCPVCKSFCTPHQDVVPIFMRGRTSPTSSSPSTSPSSSPSSSASQTPIAERIPPLPILAPAPRYAHTISFPYDSPRSASPLHVQARPPPHAPVLSIDTDLRSISPLDLQSRSHPYPHPLDASYALAHYLGIALRVLGLAILLGVLLR